MKKADIETIRKMVIDDLNWKTSVKLEDENYLEDNEYDKFSEDEQVAKCFADAKEDFISTLEDNGRFIDQESGKEEFNSLYYGCYHEFGGPAACRMAIKIAESLGVHDTKAVA